MLTDCNTRPGGASFTQRGNLESRKERYGRYDAWWSLKPSTYPFTIKDDDGVEEVLKQVRECRQEIADELGSEGIESIDNDYDNLCKEPRKVIGLIQEKAGNKGVPLPLIDNNLPQFKVSKNKNLPMELGKKLKRLIKNGK